MTFGSAIRGADPAPGLAHAPQAPRMTPAGTRGSGGSHRFETRAMGSPLRLTVHGLGAPTATRVWEAVLVEVEAVEQAMSRFRPESEVSRLNSLAGPPTPGHERAAASVVSRRLYAALAASHRAWRLTGGRFDPRVLLALERLGYAGAPIPAAAARPDGMADDSADREWIERWPRQRLVSLRAPIDLGGIGKGLALRWAWREVVRAGPSGGLLEAGGDLVAGGPSPEGGPWLVGIEDPRGGPDPLAVIGLMHGAACTSSARINRWQGPAGREVHHLIDPRTGEPGGKGLLAVTVASPDPAWAEVWSKALFLAGRTGIAALARSHGLAAWWVLDDGPLEMTAAGRSATVWPA